jgi:hypothetical protein
MLSHARADRRVRSVATLAELVRLGNIGGGQGGEGGGAADHPRVISLAKTARARAAVQASGSPGPDITLTAFQVG